MQLKQKLFLALAAYVAIAVLAWLTLSETRLRAFVWLIMGLFAVKSVLFWYARRELPDAAENRDSERTTPSASRLGRAQLEPRRRN